MNIEPPEDQYENINNLPADVIRQLLLNMDWQTSLYYCQTFKRVNNICKTGLWTEKLNKDFPKDNIRNYKDDMYNYLAARFRYLEPKIEQLSLILKDLPTSRTPSQIKFYYAIPPHRLKEIFEFINKDRTERGLVPLEEAEGTNKNPILRKAEIYGIPVANYVENLEDQYQEYINERRKISSFLYRYLSTRENKPETRSINMPANIANLGDPIDYRGDYNLNHEQEVNIRKYLKQKDFNIGDLARISVPGIDNSLYYLIGPYPSQHTIGPKLPDFFRVYINEMGLSEKDANKLYGLEYI
jgi:hypothetical protein